MSCAIRPGQNASEQLRAARERLNQIFEDLSALLTSGKLEMLVTNRDIAPLLTYCKEGGRLLAATSLIANLFWYSPKTVFVCLECFKDRGECECPSRRINDSDKYLFQYTPGMGRARIGTMWGIDRRSIAPLGDEVEGRLGRCAQVAYWAVLKKLSDA